MPRFCFNCSAEISPPLSLPQVLDVDPDRFPALAANRTILNYHLCPRCDREMSSEARATLGQRFLDIFELGSKVVALTENYSEDCLRRDPAFKMKVKIALDLHASFQRIIRAEINAHEDFARLLQPIGPAMRSLLGEKWIVSLEEVLSSYKQALQESTEATAALRRRIDLDPGDGSAPVR